MGTIIGGDFFRGRGPKFHVKFDLASNILSDITSEFEDAGINQTRHKMMLNLTGNVYVIIPGYNTATQVTTSFCIAETVIVGTVPDNFTTVSGDNRSDISKVNDYKGN